MQENFPDASILTKLAGGVPCAESLEKMTLPGLMLVGDAAHQVNPVSGGGIISGMIGGKIAGNVAAEIVRQNDMSLMAHYEKEWKNSLGSRHDRYYKIKKVIYKFKDNDLNSIADADHQAARNRNKLSETFSSRQL